MDFKSLVDSFAQIAAILSLDLRDVKNSDSYKVVEANTIYRQSVVKNLDDFVCNVPYSRYIRVDRNFEKMVEECVTKMTPVHAYVDAAFFNSWMDIYMFPLTSTDENIGYCLFSYSMTPKADVDKMMDINADTALHVLKTCLRLRETTDFQEAMDSVIADIRESCNAMRCTVLLTDFENRKCSALCEDYIDHVNDFPMDYFLDDHFFDIVETWPRLIDGSNCFMISDEEDMKRVDEVAPEWAASLRAAKVESLVIYALKNSDGETFGYIWAGNFDVSNITKIKEILEITTFILSSEIASHEMVKRMKILSSTDLLTGVMNRNAMNNRIMDHDNGINTIKVPYGVFFIDVNGLKTVNDTNGHIAGDNLLKDVAVTMKEHFEKGEIYRVGGDEFMVIAEGIDRSEFDILEKNLRKDCERPGRAHYAVGACFSDEAEDIKKAMQIADTRMYADKEEYYNRHPEYEWSRRPIAK